MSRPLRIQYPNAWYHVMNRGRRGEPVFQENFDYLTFIRLLEDTVDMWRVKIAAYCLMPNHYHLLIQTPEANLARCMRHIDGVYTQRFNRFHSSDGQLFRGRYKCILLDGDSYLLELVRYIHRNPLEAGLVDRLDKYPWSSHKAYQSHEEKWNWVYKESILSMFSTLPEEQRRLYARFVSREVAEQINEILGRKKWPSVLGSEKFIDWVKERFFGEKRHVDVPESKFLAPDRKRIKEAVCSVYGVEAEDLCLTRRGVSNEARNVGIYLMRHLRGERLEEIAEQFNIRKWSSVSTVIQRMNNKLSRNRELRKRVTALEKELKVSQEKT